MALRSSSADAYGAEENSQPNATQNYTLFTFPHIRPTHLQYVLCEGVCQHVGFLQVFVIERDPQEALPHTREEVQGDGDVSPQDNAQQLGEERGQHHVITTKRCTLQVRAVCPHLSKEDK